MSGRTSGLLLLLLIMLNHAVMACDVLVMHLPDSSHPYSTFADIAHHDMPAHQHLVTSDTNTDDGGSITEEHHPSHAHVTCGISYIHTVAVTALGSEACSTTNIALIPISYSPPVPPPNV